MTSILTSNLSSERKNFHSLLKVKASLTNSSVVNCRNPIVFTLLFIINSFSLFSITTFSFVIWIHYPISNAFEHKFYFITFIFDTFKALEDFSMQHSNGWKNIFETSAYTNTGGSKRVRERASCSFSYLVCCFYASEY